MRALTKAEIKEAARFAKATKNPVISRILKSIVQDNSKKIFTIGYRIEITQTKPNICRVQALDLQEAISKFHARTETPGGGCQGCNGQYSPWWIKCNGIEVYRDKLEDESVAWQKKRK